MLADHKDNYHWHDSDVAFLDTVSDQWASSTSQFLEEVVNLKSISLSLRMDIQSWIDWQELHYPLYDMRPRIENEMNSV
jgi:hypothetical protein